MAFVRVGGGDESPEPAKPVLLFDGVCNLCKAAVRFVVARDPAGKVRFASLQSDAGKALLRRYTSQLDPNVRIGVDDSPPTVLFVEGGRIYDRSTAALRVLRYLRGPWPALTLLLKIPKRFRDTLYDFVARRRYSWFGRAEACGLPNAEDADRFLA